MKRLPKENCQDFIRYINFFILQVWVFYLQIQLCFCMPEEYVGQPRMGAIDGCTSSCRCQELHPGLLQEQQVSGAISPALCVKPVFFSFKKNPFLNCKFFIIKFIKIIKNLLIFEYFESSSFTSFLFLNKYVPNNQLSICYFVILYRVWRNVCSNPINPSFDIVLEDQVIFHFFKKL